ncbi:MAG: DUF2442 domain-containing protein [Planctomycetes bacterium]|nr:DUF2442 domain-containing protein [Planctomycetota bacterium]
MPSAAKTRAARAVSLRVTGSAVVVRLEDGRTVSTPLAWYPRLMNGTPRERQNFKIIGGGEGVHWPDLDEDLSVEGMLAGLPSGEGRSSLERWLKSRRAK